MQAPPSSRQTARYRRFAVHLIPDSSSEEPLSVSERQSKNRPGLPGELTTDTTKSHMLLMTEKTTETTVQELDCERQNTIPMTVLTSISQQQKQPTPVMQSEISGAAGNATISGIGNIGSCTLKASSAFLMQHSLGAAAFGLYSLSLSVIMFVASIFTFGLDDAMVRYIAIYRSKRQEGLIRNLTIFCTALAGISSLLGGFGILYFAPLLAKHLLHHAVTTPLLQLMGPIIPLTSMQMIWTSGLQGFKDFKKRVLAQRIIIPAVVFLLLLVTFIFFPKNLIAIIVVTTISTVLSATFSLYFLLGRISQMRAEKGNYEVCEWLCFATPNFLTTMVDIVLDAIDTLLLGYFGIPKVGIGQYSAAIKISSFIALPLTSLNTMFSPTIAELHSKGEKQKLEAMFKVVTQWAITFSLPIFCISALFSAVLLDLLSGKDFVGAWPLLIAFGMGAMANAGTGSVGFMLLMTGHQKLSFINSLAAVIINIILGILLTPRYGAIGTAISTGLATATVNFMRLLQVRFLLQIQPYRKDSLKPLGAGLISSLVTGGCLYFMHLAQWAVKIGHIHIPIELSLVPVFLAIYIWTLMLLGTSPEDKMIIDKMKNKMNFMSRKV
jgi:O-antigen/teichoic acid export membrane protein